MSATSFPTALIAAVLVLILVLLGCGLWWWRRRQRAFRPLPAPGADGLIREVDVSYFDDAEAHPVRHRLDVYAPAGGKKLPVLLFIHGGGWIAGHKSASKVSLYGRTGETFARLGYIVVMANYRLSPFVKHPEHARDVARAFAWTRKHIARFGGDPERIFLGGHSAGAHLAALVAVEPRYLAEHGLSLAAVRGCVSISGVYRIGDFVDALAPVPVARFFGAMGPVFGTDPKVRAEASPLSHVSRKMCPFLVVYGDSEWFGLGRQAEEFLAATAVAGAPVVGICIPRRNHVTIISKAKRLEDPVVQAVGEFIKTWR